MSINIKRTLSGKEVLFSLVGMALFVWFMAEVGITPSVNEPSVKTSSVPTVPNHNYAMQDGMQYGYQSLISEEDRKAGQVAAKLVMAYYAGEREGKYQAHIMDGTMVSVIECAKPCEYLKIMTYIDADYLRDTIKVERVAATPGSIGLSIMQDAMSGKLKQYGREFNGKRYSMWMNEHNGMKRVALK